ncbi:hypothetical protein BGZ73_000208, partial [Actinomortierella ambigua]
RNNAAIIVQHHLYKSAKCKCSLHTDIDGKHVLPKCVVGEGVFGQYKEKKYGACRGFLQRCF